MAQGACQAIEDAAVLTQRLGAHPDDVPLTLQEYERARLPRTSAIQRGSWDRATTFHLPDGAAQQQRDARFAAVSGQGETMAASDWIYAHTV
jgi:salicylate hydroxylase